MTAIGVFARVFPVAPAAELAPTIAAFGFETLQLNLSAIGRPTLDTALDQSAAVAIRAAFNAHRLNVWGLSGTFNATHPDPVVRSAGIEGCLAVIRAAPAMGAAAVTLCTGTRDPLDMWRHHPDNVRPDAWFDLRATLDLLVPAASEAGVLLGIEPEVGNVVRDAPTARRLLDQLGADARHLTIVLDPANLLTPATLPTQTGVLREAFDLLGDRIGCVHAKDVAADGAVACGLGGLDYGLIAELHAMLPHDPPVIAQDLAAGDAARVVGFLRERFGRPPD